MRCDGETAQKLERELLLGTVNHTLFGDDTIVKEYIPVTPHRYFVPFDIEVKQEHAGASLGHQFIPAICDLEQDFHKLGKSLFGVDRTSMRHEMDFKAEILGDILPVRQIGFSLYCCPTQDIVHIMKMEDMFTAMLDYPELFHRMMSMLATDYLAFFNLLETENVFLPMVDECHLCQGSYSYTDEIPQQGAGLKTADIWGYMDSQETSGVSPTMFAEHIAPHYKRIAERTVCCHTAAVTRLPLFGTVFSPTLIIFGRSRYRRGWMKRSWESSCRGKTLCICVNPLLIFSAWVLSWTSRP